LILHHREDFAEIKEPISPSLLLSKKGIRGPDIIETVKEVSKKILFKNVKPGLNTYMKKNTLDGSWMRPGDQTLA
jgi:hypothetical protein